MLGISRAVLTGLVAEGFVTPARGPRNEYRFSFQDVVLLRTAHALRQARIPTSRILRSLKRLRATLPKELPLTGLRITAVGPDVAVREGATQWAAESGQLLMDFEVARVGGEVSVMESPPAVPADVTASECFEQGQALEGSDRAAAEASYREALVLEPAFADASLNLGAMLCEDGRCGEALRVFDAAIAASDAQALLHFNRAIALEDLGRAEEARRAYERALEMDPSLSDAHFNLARLHELAGRAQAALRHYSAYRRLTK